MKHVPQLEVNLSGVLLYLLGQKTVHLPLSSEMKPTEVTRILSKKLGKILTLDQKDKHWMLTIEENPPLSFSIMIFLNHQQWNGNPIDPEIHGSCPIMHWLAPIGGG